MNITRTLSLEELAKFDLLEDVMKPYHDFKDSKNIDVALVFRNGLAIRRGRELMLQLFPQIEELINCEDHYWLTDMLIPLPSGYYIKLHFFSLFQKIYNGIGFHRVFMERVQAECDEIAQGYDYWQSRGICRSRNKECIKFFRMEREYI
jgi:hypothetical protein